LQHTLLIDAGSGATEVRETLFGCRRTRCCSLHTACLRQARDGSLVRPEVLAGKTGLEVAHITATCCERSGPEERRVGATTYGSLTLTLHPCADLITRAAELALRLEIGLVRDAALERTGPAGSVGSRVECLLL
jgi:hypothetical protein